MLVIAIDTGGTFTDLAAFDLTTRRFVSTKSLTTYDNLANGAFDCLRKADISPADGVVFKHGTTLAINSLLQRMGARTALVATKGFRDLLEMARGNRPDPFDLFYRRHPPLIERDMRFEIAERMSAKGEADQAPDKAEVAKLASHLRSLDVESVAVAFLNSYVAPEHEEQVAQWLKEMLPGVFVTRSTELSREWYEYERTATAAANAYVGPQVAGYVRDLNHRLQKDGFEGRFFLMASNGGMLGVQNVLETPIALVESGPVGGSIGAATFAKRLGIQNAIAFDMGGTTAKCALVQDGRFDVKSVYHVGGYARGFPIRGAVIDIVEVGAGGGSIAWLDAQARLYVGPKSAGSMPGPVAYGRGGAEPTVTDANIVLGKVDPDGFLGGAMKLDAAAAARAIRERLAEPLGYGGHDGVLRIADGIVTIASVTMAGAIKRITLEKGLDPRDYTLFAFGGGGPLHACDIARQLAIPHVVIPPEPGNFSALGMLLANLRLDETVTFIRPVDDDALAASEQVFDELSERMAAALRQEIADTEVSFERYAEIRYRGQTHSVRTPLNGVKDPAGVRRRFEEVYRTRYGHADAKKAIEFVSLAVAAHGGMAGPALDTLQCQSGGTEPAFRRRSVYFGATNGAVETRVYRRNELPAGFAKEGPALIEEYGSTTAIGPQDRFSVGELGEIHIHLGRQQKSS
ncbi:MAG: N-methylhydantoinase A [Pseudolabrys sp.]|jgi:N-methylhydantoinase A|nr:N-methylhydantoinase A [Pseudolabrys sp.]